MKARAEMKLRVGVVGCGMVGVIHARSYLENPAVDFVGVCDINRELVAEQSARLHVPGYDSIAEMAAEGRPELVSVVVRFDQLVAPVREASRPASTCSRKSRSRSGRGRYWIWSTWQRAAR